MSPKTFSVCQFIQVRTWWCHKLWSFYNNMKWRNIAHSSCVRDTPLLEGKHCNRSDVALNSKWKRSRMKNWNEFSMWKERISFSRMQTDSEISNINDTFFHFLPISKSFISFHSQLHRYHSHSLLRCYVYTISLFCPS